VRQLVERMLVLGLVVFDEGFRHFFVSDKLQFVDPTNDPPAIAGGAYKTRQTEVCRTSNLSVAVSSLEFRLIAGPISGSK
jgi:hypothetical protein